MNITESDSNIDIEEVREIVTNDFKGDKIERLLYEAGLDTEHKVGEEGTTVLEITAENVTVIMSETWEADGEWYIDPATVILDVLVNRNFVNTSFPDRKEIPSENELVAYITNIFEEELN
jgi:hypothetical protein